MKTYTQLIQSALINKQKKSYPAVFWCIDLHDTIIEGKYSRFNEGASIYPDALEVLHFLHRHPDHRTILWTSSHNDSAVKAVATHNLKFHYFNENPECPTTELCNFDQKFYFNILIDDKCGFEGHTDWSEIKNALKEIYGEQVALPN